jgi:hypothetical protein
MKHKHEKARKQHEMDASHKILVGAPENVICAMNNVGTNSIASAGASPSWSGMPSKRLMQIVTTGGASGYVELLTCLQTAKVEETKPADPFGPLPSIEK